jgi:aminoglycoside phosphotransferase (APT) family kinase protein
MCDQPGLVAAWLSRNGEAVVSPVVISRVGVGQSNITTIVADAEGREWVLREPPAGARKGTAHDVHREAGIIDALAGSGIPVPRVIGADASPAGVPFFVMDRVAGAPLETENDAGALTASQRRELGFSMIGTLAQLHSIDPQSVGLATRSEPYVIRQLRRFGATWADIGVDSRHDSTWQALRARLENECERSVTSRTVVAHGDFRLSNLLVDGAEITAVLDWELCAAGDPLADLAWMLGDWRSPDEPAISIPSPTRVGGFPTRDELIDAYSSQTGFDVGRLDFYRGFSQWRAANILQGVLVRHRNAMGTYATMDLDLADVSVGNLLASAAEHLARLS